MLFIATIANGIIGIMKAIFMRLCIKSRIQLDERERVRVDITCRNKLHSDCIVAMGFSLRKFQPIWNEGRCLQEFGTTMCVLDVHPNREAFSSLRGGVIFNPSKKYEEHFLVLTLQ